MLKKFILLLLIVGSLFANEKEVKVKELMNVSGLNEQIELLDKAYMKAIKLKFKKDGLLIEKHLKKMYSIEDVKHYVYLRLGQSMIIEDINYLIDWFNSPLGMNIVKAENYSSSPAWEKKRRELDKNTVYKSSRMKLITDLDKGIKYQGMSIYNGVNFYNFIFNLAGVKENKKVEFLNKFRKYTYENSSKSLYLVYKNLTDEQIKQYISLTRKYTFKKFNEFGPFSILSFYEKLFKKAISKKQ